VCVGKEEGKKEENSKVREKEGGSRVTGRLENSTITTTEKKFQKSDHQEK